MSDHRNAYGFPRQAAHGNPCEYARADGSLYGFVMMGMSTVSPRGSTKLERAQAIAAEVRARKFPAPRRITPKDE